MFEISQNRTKISQLVRKRPRISQHRAKLADVAEFGPRSAEFGPPLADSRLANIHSFLTAGSADPLRHDMSRLANARAGSQSARRLHAGQRAMRLHIWRARALRVSVSPLKQLLPRSARRCWSRRDPLQQQHHHQQQLRGPRPLSLAVDMFCPCDRPINIDTDDNGRSERSGKPPQTAFQGSAVNWKRRLPAHQCVPKAGGGRERGREATEEGAAEKRGSG